MADFEKALEFVLDNEGRTYEEPPHIDQPTNSGIIARDIAIYRGVDVHTVTKDDIQLLSKAEIRGIYLTQYWEKLRMNEVKNTGIATCIFDTGVNRGISIGAKYTQKVCNALGSALVVDGVIGARTLAAVNSYQPKTFITHYEALVVAGYMALLEHKISFHKYEKGWLRRAARLLTLA